MERLQKSCTFESLVCGIPGDQASFEDREGYGRDPPEAGLCGHGAAVGVGSKTMGELGVSKPWRFVAVVGLQASGFGSKGKRTGDG